VCSRFSTGCDLFFQVAEFCLVGADFCPTLPTGVVAFGEGVFYSGFCTMVSMTSTNLNGE
jgi:hypothetical protein